MKERKGRGMKWGREKTNADRRSDDKKEKSVRKIGNEKRKVKRKDETE